MRMGFRDPFADEPSLLLSFLPTPLLLWQRSGVGARQVRSYGRRKELTYNKIQGGRYFKAEGVLNEAAQFSIWQLRRHFICNWNWCSAASANMSEDEANSPRSEVNSWQLTVPHTGSNIRDGGGLTLMLMNYGERSLVCGGPWVRDSIACRAVCSNLASRLLGLQPQPARSVPAREGTRRKNVVCSEGDASKPVDGTVCGSWIPLQPTWTSVQRWLDMTGRISPSGAQIEEHGNLHYKTMQTGLFLLRQYRYGVQEWSQRDSESGNII